MEPLRGGRESIPVDLRAEPSVLPGCLELHFPYLGGKSTHLHLAWANPGRNVQGTMVSSQSPPREPHLTRSTSSIAVPEGPRSRGGKQRFNRPVPTQRPLLLHMPPTLPALGGPPPLCQAARTSTGSSGRGRPGLDMEVKVVLGCSSPDQGYPAPPCPTGTPHNLTLILTSFGASFFTSLSNRSPKPVNTRLGPHRMPQH